MSVFCQGSILNILLCRMWALVHKVVWVWTLCVFWLTLTRYFWYHSDKWFRCEFYILVSFMRQLKNSHWWIKLLFGHNNLFHFHSYTLVSYIDVEEKRAKYTTLWYTPFNWCDSRWRELYYWTWKCLSVK